LTSSIKLQNHIEAIEFKNMLSDEGDTLSAVLQILLVLVEPSAIGPLMRMYMMWGESTATKSKN
jgi:peptide chain release factor 2